MKDTKKQFHIPIPTDENIKSADLYLKAQGVCINKIMAIDAEDPIVAYDIDTSDKYFCAAIAGRLFGRRFGDIYAYSEDWFGKNKDVKIANVVVSSIDNQYYDTKSNQHEFSIAVAVKIMQRVKWQLIKEGEI